MTGIDLYVMIFYTWISTIREYDVLRGSMALGRWLALQHQSSVVHLPLSVSRLKKMYRSRSPAALDCRRSKFAYCVWIVVLSDSPHHLQESLLTRFRMYVHRNGLKPHSFTAALMYPLTSL